MTDKPRKSKRPKAMQAKTRVTTEATKAKLPRPRKRRPLPKPMTREDILAARERAAIPRVQCPRCEKWVPDHPHDIHSCYDAKALREAEARAIPCGEDGYGNMLSFVERSGNWVKEAWTPNTPRPEGDGWEWNPLHGAWIRPNRSRVPPPDTSAYPWPIRWRQALTRPLIRAMKATAYRLRLWAWHLEGNP